MVDEGFVTVGSINGSRILVAAMNSKCVEQRCGKREIRKAGYTVALQVGENLMSAETSSADSIVIGQ